MKKNSNSLQISSPFFWAHMHLQWILWALHDKKKVHTAWLSTNASNKKIA